MVSRAAHYRNKARHAQREFGEAKPRLLSRDEGTTWMPTFIASLNNGDTLTVHSEAVLPLANTAEERTLKLRELSKIGVLRMYAYRENGLFVEYRWTVKKD